MHTSWNESVLLYDHFIVKYGNHMTMKHIITLLALPFLDTLNLEHNYCHFTDDILIVSCDQAALRTLLSACRSVCHTFYPRRTAKVMFSSLLVCVAVCLLATLRKNGFHEIFRSGGTWYKDQSGTFRDVPFNTLNTENLFKHFRENPCLLTTWQENERTDFHDFF